MMVLIERDMVDLDHTVLMFLGREREDETQTGSSP